ncbi:hypothetical protein M422DRAFT_275287 [Sphaerobolus stellatus SS14]|uniref:Uncharacterized protein n=1 Tax=Sphaerobolus stellatus (strain SS14) TaxID=990650 RepID=A0A0C9T591_SPHS4|nr:hypothetical protein M422DRAFT_275287 [Sphaerobolus stellatus SS14]
MIDAKEAQDPEVCHKVLALRARNIEERCVRYSNLFQPLVKTRMMIPIRDILRPEPTKGYRFGMHGVVLTIKGHEELFFEFNSIARRDTFIELVEQQCETLRERQLDGGHTSPSPAKREALFLEELHRCV